MDGYRELKKEQEKNAKKLKEANNKSDKLNYKTEEINNILDNLKPLTFNKNNKQISNEDVEKIKNYAKEVEDTTKSIKSVNNLNVIIDNIEQNYKDLVNNRDSLYYSNNEKDTIIANLKEEIEFKNKKINKLELALDKVKTELSRFKDYVKECMENNGFTKIETRLGTLSIAKSPASVEILNEDEIPSEFKQEVVSIKIDKTKIKNNFKETGEIPAGVNIVTTNTNLRIK